MRARRPDRPRPLPRPAPRPPRGRSASRDGTAAGELAARFGPRSLTGPCGPYLEKIDGLPLERIPDERARRLLEDQAAPDGFHFPARGIGQLMDAMAEAARAAGAEVLLGAPVEAIDVRGGTVGGVRVVQDGIVRHIGTERRGHRDARRLGRPAALPRRPGIADPRRADAGGLHRAVCASRASG